MIVTRKIEIYPDGTQQEKQNAWDLIRSLNRVVYKAYNTVISHQYFNDLLVERIRKSDEDIADRNSDIEKKIEAISSEIASIKGNDDPQVKRRDKLKEQKTKLYKQLSAIGKEARAKAEGLYLSSEQNTTYQIISTLYPQIPSYIRACINSEAYSAYKNDYIGVMSGERSIRTYRKGLPIPFQKSAMRFFVEKSDGVPIDNQRIGINWIGGVIFYMKFGQDKSNNREIVNRIISNTYRASDSKILLDGKKIFLLLCVDIPEVEKELDKDLIVGVNLGLVVPAYCALSDGLERSAIGSADDLLRVRIQFQKRRQRLQRALVMVSGGRGRKDKLKALDSLKEKERNYVRTYNHLVSSEIIKFALKHRAGTIHMELLEGFGDDEKNKFVLRNWSYFELHTMVEYKAKKYGIDVKYTDPYRVSQTCNCCGEFNENNLESREDFVCKNEKCSNFAIKIFSDYNAALNNAKSTLFADKKEDCLIYKMRTSEANAM